MTANSERSLEYYEDLYEVYQQQTPHHQHSPIRESGRNPIDKVNIVYTPFEIGRIASWESLRQKLVRGMILHNLRGWEQRAITTTPDRLIMAASAPSVANHGYKYYVQCIEQAIFPA